MVCEGDVVEVVIGVVGVEGAPAAIGALQPLHPFAASIDRLVILAPPAWKALGPIHGHDHHSGVIQIRIMVVAILKRPAAGTHLRPPLRPIPLRFENLQGPQPGQTSRGGAHRGLPASLKQGVGGQGGVPHRREARLAIGFVVLDDQELLYCGAGCGAAGILRPNAQRVVHHHRIGHGRKDGAKTILPIEALVHEGASLVYCALVRGTGKAGPDKAQNPVQGEEQAGPGLLLVRAAGQVLDLRGMSKEDLVDCDAAWVASAGLQGPEDQKRHDYRARPIADLGEMDGKPPGQMHDLHRNLWRRPPGDDAEQGQHQAGEDIAGARSASGDQGLPCPDHMRGVRIVADHLQGEIGLHRAAHIEVPSVEERPAPVVGLDAAQINADLALQLRRVGLAQIGAKENIFRRDSGVGLQLEQPMAVSFLARDQGLGRAGDGGFQVGGGVQREIGGVVHSRFLSRLAAKFEGQIGSGLARADGPFDGCRQSRRRPVASQDQISPGRRGRRAQRVLLRRGGEGGAAFLDDSPGRRLWRQTMNLGDVAPEGVGQRLPVLVRQIVGRADRH